MGLDIIVGVVDASTNFIDSTPTGTSVQVGDRIFRTATGELAEFKDVSTTVSQSYSFDGNSGIEVDGTVLDVFDSNTRFSQHFSTYVEANNNTPLLSYTLEKLDSAIRDEDSDTLNIALHGNLFFCYTVEPF